MSDTPEMDAFSVSFKSIDDQAGKKKWVPADFAGRLERERDEAREALACITEAAQAVVDRWEQPPWKDTEPTRAVIYRLRDALGREAE
jgi:hypothetical protein